MPPKNVTEKLHRDVFVALAAIARADGKVEADEMAALLRAATDEGLAEDDLLAIEHAATSATDLNAIDLSALSPRDAIFVYALAYWISRVDGEMSEEEDVQLGSLGARLSLSDAARMAAEGLVDEVAALPQGERPARYDLGRLRDTIGERLARAL